MFQEFSHMLHFERASGPLPREGVDKNLDILVAGDEKGQPVEPLKVLEAMQPCVRDLQHQARIVNYKHDVSLNANRRYTKDINDVGEMIIEFLDKKLPQKMEE